jgi:DNA-binding NtrC family response regulator
VPLRRFSSAALNALRQHAWSGGYGELKGAVKSLALASLGEEIGEEEALQLLAPAGEPSLAPAGLAPEVIELPLREAREAFERMYFEYHLAKDGGNMTRLAERTGLERTHLYRKLKDLGLR